MSFLAATSNVIISFGLSEEADLQVAGEGEENTAAGHRQRALSDTVIS